MGVVGSRGCLGGGRVDVGHLYVERETCLKLQYNTGSIV